MGLKLNKILILLFISVMLILGNYVYSAKTLSERWGELEGYSGTNIILDFLKDWKELAVVSMVISVAIMALMYILGEAFDIQLLKYYFRLEFKEIIANALLIIFFVATLSFIDYVAVTFGFGPNGQAICDSSKYNGFCLEDLIYDFLKKSYYDPITDQVIKVNANIASSNKGVGFHIGVEDIRFLYTSMGYSYDYSASSYQNLIIRGFYEMAYVALIVTLFSLNLSKSLIGPAIIALGIILRNFFFTKRAGSTLIAVGLGIMVFYPVFMYLFYLPFFQPLSQFNSEEKESCPAACFDRVVALNESNNDKGISLRELTRVYKEYGASSGDYSAFLDGEEKEITINGVDYLSCEYEALQLADAFIYSNDEITQDILSTTYTEINGFKEQFPSSNPKHGLYCFPQCRVLPYPDDSVECRDAESVCRVLYDAHPECFTKVYAYEDDPDYNSILEFYGYFEQQQKEAYENNCPIECRSIPNLAPGYKDGSLGLFCPSPCREIPVKITGSGNFNYELKYKDKLPDFCKDEKYDCLKEGNGNDWYDFSDNNYKTHIFTSDQWEDAITEIHQHMQKSNSINHPYYSIKLYPSSQDAESTCGACTTYPKPMRYYPIYIDCSVCAKNPPVPSISSTMSFTDSITLEIGKVLLLVYGIPLMALVTTIYAVSGLSTYMQGDMFIPAISKIMR